MNYINKWATPYQIAKLIYENGPSTTDRIASLMPQKTKRAVEVAVSRMHNSGDLEKEGSVFSLAPKVYRHFASRDSELLQIASPRTAPAFKPLSDKHKFWLVPRREPLRGISFINGGCEFRKLGEPA